MSITPSREEQRQALDVEMRRFALWNRKRDALIKAAFKAGFRGTEIAQTMGIARSTVIRARDRMNAELARRDTPSDVQTPSHGG